MNCIITQEYCAIHPSGVAPSCFNYHGGCPYARRFAQEQRLVSASRCDVLVEERVDELVKRFEGRGVLAGRSQ